MSQVGAGFSMGLPWEGGVWRQGRGVMTYIQHLSPVLPQIFVISFFLSHEGVSIYV